MEHWDSFGVIPPFKYIFFAPCPFPPPPRPVPFMVQAGLDQITRCRHKKKRHTHPSCPQIATQDTASLPPTSRVGGPFPSSTLNGDSRLTDIDEEGDGKGTGRG